MSARGALAKRILERAQARRSPLYRWLRENHADIATAMSLPRPSWTALAETAAESGQVDDHGKPPNANSVRAAWIRVCRDLGKPHGARQPTKRQVQGAQAHPASGRPEPDAPPSPDHPESWDEPPIRHIFRPAKLR
jgi:hypothetical protein